MGTCQMHSSLSTIGLGSVFFSFFFPSFAFATLSAPLLPALPLQLRYDPGCEALWAADVDWFQVWTLVLKLWLSNGSKWHHWCGSQQPNRTYIYSNTSKHLEVPRLNWNLGLAFGLAGFPSHQQHLRSLLIGVYVKVPNSQSIFGDIFHHRDPYRILKYWMPKVVFPPPPRSSMSPGPDSQSNLQTLARYGVLIPGVARILSKPVWGPPGRIMYEVTRFDTPNFLMASGTSTTKSTSEELSPKPFTEEPKA